MPTSVRYHVMARRKDLRIKNPKETTVSLDDYLSDLLALSLNVTPNTPAAHKSVKEWIQNRVDNVNLDIEKYGVRQSNLSQLIQQHAIIQLVDRGLVNKYFKYHTERHKNG